VIPSSLLSCTVLFAIMTGEPAMPRTGRSFAPTRMPELRGRV